MHDEKEWVWITEFVQCCVSCQCLMRWVVSCAESSAHPFKPRRVQYCVFVCMPICHWLIWMCAMSVMSSQSCWGIIMPKEGMRWILCWVSLFYHYCPGWRDAKVQDAAAIYISLMNLLALTCILLLFSFTTGTWVEKNRAQFHDLIGFR